MNEWYKNWFSSDEYLSVYRHRDNEDAQKLINHILSETNIIKEGIVLDAACGAGRHSINLAKKGFHVVGFDLSKTLLNIGKSDAQSNNVSIDLFCGDLRNIKLKKKFDLIINLFTSFGYFNTDDENFSFIRTAYDLLNENCYYILDYFNPEYIRNNLVQESKREFGSKKITERRKIENERVIKEIIIQNGSALDSFFESVQLYSREKIIGEFEKIGYRCAKIFGDYTGSKFVQSESQRLILFFEK
ncbi:MAG: class I SAM-dependent methyltransferase [Ignavibacteriae bacterium HGW-Ignavibacteriae-3]|nr:MAG: class I SAM-dependent methyltransferase [Ignavibacteriae bacterium HGW-Ignavibacteriae-3]